jgi:N-acetylmuramoyl-L-alanine amidase
VGARAKVAAALLTLALQACAPAPQQSGLPNQWLASPNFGERRPNFVILHHTSSATAERALATLTDPQRGVSAHYLIHRDGRLYQLVDERMRAWHAGDAYWGGNTDINSASIGIELDNDGEEPFAEPQIIALLALLADLRERYKIPAANFIGHGDVAPQRKADPSRYFPWKRLAERGYGLWCDPPESPAPPALDTLSGLQALGYDVANPSAAVAAFRRHFLAAERPDESDLNPQELAVLGCLIVRKRG